MKFDFALPTTAHATDSCRSSNGNLSLSYVTNKHTVVSGRFIKITKKVEGNLRLNLLVQSYAAKYSAGNKTSRSHCVSDIIHVIRKAGGTFIRIKQGGDWVELGEAAAREVVTSRFRDVLSAKYKSSTKSKVASRRLKRKNSETGQSSDTSDVTPDLCLFNEYDYGKSWEAAHTFAFLGKSEDEITAYGIVDASHLRPEDLDFDARHVFDDDEHGILHDIETAIDAHLVAI